MPLKSSMTNNKEYNSRLLFNSYLLELNMGLSLCSEENFLSVLLRASKWFVFKGI